MKLLKEPKLPKLKQLKFKCKYCGAVFIEHEKELVRNRPISNTVICPVCGVYLNLTCKQVRKLHRYGKITDYRRKMYGSENKD